MSGRTNRPNRRRQGPEIQHVEVDSIVGAAAGVERLPRRYGDVGRCATREHHAEPVEGQPIAFVQPSGDGRRDEICDPEPALADIDDPDQQTAADVDPGKWCVDPGDRPMPVDPDRLEHLVRAAAPEIIPDESDHHSIGRGHVGIVASMTMTMTMTRGTSCGSASRGRMVKAPAAGDGWVGAGIWLTHGPTGPA